MSKLFQAQPKDKYNELIKMARDYEHINSLRSAIIAAADPQTRLVSANDVPDHIVSLAGGIIYPLRQQFSAAFALLRHEGVLVPALDGQGRRRTTMSNNADNRTKPISVYRCTKRVLSEEEQANERWLRLLHDQRKANDEAGRYVSTAADMEDAWA